MTPVVAVIISHDARCEKQPRVSPDDEDHRNRLPTRRNNHFSLSRETTFTHTSPPGLSDYTKRASHTHPH